MENKYFFFYDGCLSNWYMESFIVDGIKYNCGEQYLMYQKAITFNDNETAGRILKERYPANQKNLGREVKNFIPEIWDNVKYNLLKEGLRLKFLQNEYLKEYLLKHKGFILVEASPTDRIWGIGFEWTNALENIDNWGENLLGKILTELSNEIE